MFGMLSKKQSLRLDACPVQIEIHAQRNEILDQSSLILRYQAEIRQLRAQLEEAAKGRGVALTVDPLHPEVSAAAPKLQWTQGHIHCGTRSNNCKLDATGFGGSRQSCCWL